MTAVSLPIKKTPNSRSIGPDAVRAFAAVLVVYLHGCIPYLVHKMPGLVWPVSDATNGIVDALFWAIEIFIMPFFLVISGFFAYRALVATDGHSFLKSRANRLLRPLLFGIFILLPIILYIWMIGLVAECRMPVVKLRSLKIPQPFGDQIWGLSHLWFLLYVFLYSAFMVGVNRVLRNRIPMRLRPTLRQTSAILIPAVGALTLVFAPEVVFGFQHAFLPVFSKWLYSGSFFAGGAALANFDPKFRSINRLAGRHLLLGTFATGIAVLLGCWTLRLDPEQARTASSAWLVSITLATTTVLAAWSLALGVIGMSNRSSVWLVKHKRTCQAIEYLSGASFWIYLVHHPIVGLVHIDLKFLTPSMDPLTKSLLAASIAIACGLGSYEYIVRTTRFGRFIGLTSKRATEGTPVSWGEASKKPRRPVRIAA